MTLVESNMRFLNLANNWYKSEEYTIKLLQLVKAKSRAQIWIREFWIRRALVQRINWRYAGHLGICRSMIKRVPRLKPAELILFMPNLELNKEDIRN